MSRARTVEVGWVHEDEDYRVTLSVHLGTPKPFGMYPGCSSRWVPGDEDAEVEILEVAEDAPGGALRPDLIEAAEEDFAHLEELAVEMASEYDGPDDTLEEARGER